MNKQEIQEWIIDHLDYFKEISAPIKKQKEESMKAFDVVFHDDIDKQYQEQLKTIICIEASKSLACSTESVYDIIEDEKWEGIWKKIFY